MILKDLRPLIDKRTPVAFVDGRTGAGIYSPSKQASVVEEFFQRQELRQIQKIEATRGTLLITLK